MKLNGLENYFKANESGEIVDFKQINGHGRSPLKYALENNKSKNLNLSHEQLEYLIQNSDLTQGNNGYSSLMYAFLYNEEENLNLSNKQFDYLIQNSNLKRVNEFGWSPLMYALYYNKGVMSSS